MYDPLKSSSLEPTKYKGASIASDWLVFDYSTPYGPLSSTRTDPGADIEESVLSFTRYNHPKTPT